MRLCRRHGWVRAELQSGKFDLTSAALLETAFAGAERQGRQRTGSGRPPGIRPQDAGRQEAAALRVRLPGRHRPQSPILPGAHAGRRHGALFLPLFGAWCGHATRGVVVTAIRSPAVAVALPTCCRSTTCCRSPRAAAKIRIIYASRASLITGCGTAVSRLRNWKVGIRHCVMGLGGRQRQRLPGRERAQERTSRIGPRWRPPGDGGEAGGPHWVASAMARSAGESVPVCAAPRRSCEPVRIRARSPCAH